MGCCTPIIDSLGHPESPGVDNKETFQEKEIFVFFTSKYASYDFYRNNRVLPRISDCLVELLEKVEKIYSEVCDIEN